MQIDLGNRRFWLILFTLGLLSSCSTLKNWITPVATTAMTCKLFADEFVKSPVNPPLYEKRAQACKPVSDPDKLANGVYFLDGNCQKAVPFYGETFQRYCATRMVPGKIQQNTLGNPPGWKYYLPGKQKSTAKKARYETPWTLSHGTQVKAGVIDLTKETRPFVKGVEYRRVGNCSLGMSIYKADPLAKGLKAAMIIHGGAWTYRGTGASIGNEATAPNFTKRGYVVFAPFYRLIGNQSGPEACRGVTGKAQQADLLAALDWVLARGGNYGMKKGTPIDLAGQSSGAQSAAFVALNRPQAVRKVLFLYGPTDFPFFIEESKPGGLWPDAKQFAPSKAALITYSGQTAQTVGQLNPRAPLMQENDFPALVAKNRGKAPRIFMIMGDADQLGPIELPVRLCQAYGGKPLSREKYQPPCNFFQKWINAKACSPKIACDSAGSRLQIVHGAGHALDLKCFHPLVAQIANHVGNAPLAINPFCPSGDKKGEAIVEEALLEAYNEFFTP